MSLLLFKVDKVWRFSVLFDPQMLSFLFILSVAKMWSTKTDWLVVLLIVLVGIFLCLFVWWCKREKVLTWMKYFIFLILLSCVQNLFFQTRLMLHCFEQNHQPQKLQHGRFDHIFSFSLAIQCLHLPHNDQFKRSIVESTPRRFWSSEVCAWENPAGDFQRKCDSNVHQQLQ